MGAERKMEGAKLPSEPNFSDRGSESFTEDLLPVWI